jgi:hypothetical protein
MRHASIRTTMNIYGEAMTDSKRQAQQGCREIVLNGGKPGEKVPVAAIGSYERIGRGGLQCTERAKRGVPPRLGGNRLKTRNIAPCTLTVRPFHEWGKQLSTHFANP